MKKAVFILLCLYLSFLVVDSGELIIDVFSKKGIFYSKDTKNI